MEEEPFISRIRNKAGKIAKAMVFASALGTGGSALAEDFGKLPGQSVESRSGETEKDLAENAETFLKETVEPFIADIQRDQEIYNSEDDSRGLLSEEYAQGRERMTSTERVALIVDHKRATKIFEERKTAAARFMTALDAYQAMVFGREDGLPAQLASRISSALSRLDEIHKDAEGQLSLERAVTARMERMKAKELSDSLKRE